MSLLQLSSISRSEEGNRIVDNISFIQNKFQKIAIAGETGSGKSTLLKVISGLVQIDSGQVLFEEKKVKGPFEKLFPGHPHIAYLSQNFELRNNYRVEELLQMASKVSDKDAILIYNICKIDHLLKRGSNELSGGERQRVAFAKTLVSAPKLLLLDEPFSNLDAIHRAILKTVISDIQAQLYTTCILVSHDPVDLLSWADEIIVLYQGKIIQKGIPKEIYNFPANEYVAALFGNYCIISPKLIELFPQLAEGKRWFIRPNDFTLTRDKDQGVNAEIKAVNFMGSYFEIEVDVSGNQLITISQHPYFKGENAFVRLNDSK